MKNLLIFTILCTIQDVACSTRAYVGIDLGTTFSCVSIYYPDTKSYDYLTYDQPERKTFPSTIYFTGDSDKQTQLPNYWVGYMANTYNEQSPNPKNYIYGFKRIVGIDRIEKSSRLSGFRNEVSYNVEDKTFEGKGYLAIPVEVDGVVRDFTPTDLSAIILGDIKDRLEKLGISEIVSTCISTPVYFTTVQDDEVKEAGRKAGFKNPIITKEPVAACVSYVDQHMFTLDSEEKIMVFDFGGGTLDISVVEVIKEKSDDSPGKFDSSIVANRFVGDNFLGGENVNSRICEEFEEIAKKSGCVFSSYDKLRLRLFVEAMKIKLCNEQSTSQTDVVVSEKFWFKDGKDITFTLSHSRFNQLLKPIYDRINYLLYDKHEGLFKDDSDPDTESVRDTVKKIILVGGSTRIPEIRNILKSACPKALIFDEIDADKAVGMGACKICVSSDSSSGDSTITVLGAVPLPIGIRLSDGSFESLIQQNVAIPTDASKTFTTVYDNQTTILIDVAMGVRPMFDDNDKIGQLKLNLKKARPKGVPQIVVLIEYYGDYSFKITAEDAETKDRESEVFRSDLGKPSKDKIEQILENAKKFKAEDEETGKKLEQFKLYDAAFTQLESQFNIAKDNAQVDLNDFDKSYFETIIDGNRKWLDENRGNKAITASVIQSKLEDLQSASAELMKKMETSQKPSEQPTEPKEKEAREVL